MSALAMAPVEGVADAATLREQLTAALHRGDFDAALTLANTHGDWLRARCAEQPSPPPNVLRQWHDTYQGLLGHVQALREDTRAELGRITQGGHAARAYGRG